MDPSLLFLPKNTDEYTVGALASIEDWWQKEILSLTREIENLTRKNIQLKDDHMTADLHCINMMENLVSREKELENLRAEVSRLNKMIASLEMENRGNALANESDLLEQIIVMNSELKQNKKELSVLQAEHSACPSVADVEKILANLRDSFDDKMSKVDEEMSSKDRVIEQLEEIIARKDVELQTKAEQLLRVNAECVENKVREDRRIKEMENVVQDRERLIDKMRVLLSRKSVKVNLLLLRIQELEARLSSCRRGIRTKRPSDSQSSPFGLIDEQTNAKGDLQSIKETKSSRQFPPKHLNCGDHYSEEDDDLIVTSDTSTGKSELGNTSENDSIYLINWLDKMKAKFNSKSEKEIKKKDELAVKIRDFRLKFDRTQLEIEHIRKNKENVHQCREQIRKLVFHEKCLNEMMETLEKQKRACALKISSFDKALKNLDALGKLLQPLPNEN